MRYELLVASAKTLKQEAAKAALLSYHRQNYPHLPLETITRGIDLPEAGRRPDQPIAFFTSRSIRHAAHTRVNQLETTSPYATKQRHRRDVRRLIFAQESGMRLNTPFLWPFKGIFNDVTVAVVKDIDDRQGSTGVGLSKGVRIKLADALATIRHSDKPGKQMPLGPALLEVVKNGGVYGTTIGKTIVSRHNMPGADTHVDWYQQYNSGNQPRGDYVTQATQRALGNLDKFRRAY